MSPNYYYYLKNEEDNTARIKHFVLHYMKEHNCTFEEACTALNLNHSDALNDIHDNEKA